MSVQERQAGPTRHRLTAREFYRMVDLGFFRHLNDRVELIDGTIIQMPPQKNLHAMGISLSQDALVAVFGPDHWVRVQMTLDLTPYSVVDPDLAVIAGQPEPILITRPPRSRDGSQLQRCA